MRWLGTAKVAERIDATPRQVRERYALRPDFPTPSRPGGTGHPKWREDEIDAWMERWNAERAPGQPPLPVTNNLSYRPEYNTWKKMHDRCRNPKATQYKWYGARGISVCERWRSFALFLKDMGPRPTPQHSIDRIDNERGYEPGNCRWATRDQQYANRRQPIPLGAYIALEMLG